jgi:hypothetical protein
MLTAAAAAVSALAQPQQNSGTAKGMDLGVFSVSLAVKDIEASRKFYEKLGFRAFAGNASKGLLIMRNGDTIIGLFQGMFEKNILTFNPGWDNNTQKKASFTEFRPPPSRSAFLLPSVAAAGRAHRRRVPPRLSCTIPTETRS